MAGTCDVTAKQTCVRACGQCQTTNFTFCDKRHGETGLHCVMETARPCEAQMHVQHCRCRSAGMQTRNNALKWIKPHINNKSMNSGIQNGLGRSCQCDKPNPAKANWWSRATPSVPNKPPEEKQSRDHDARQQDSQQSHQFVDDGPTPRTGTPSSN